MTPTNTGILVGAVLAISWVAFGFWAFVFVALAMGVGAVIGRIVSGQTDFKAIVDAVRGKRVSS